MKKSILFLTTILSISISSFSQVIDDLPYFENFENSSTSWTASGDWEFGTPNKSTIDDAYSGSNCWVTKLTGSYSNGTISILTSPAFDLSALERPYISFRMIYLTESGYDDIHIEYSTNTQPWTKLNEGSIRTPNWYQNNGTWSGNTSAYSIHFSTIDHLPSSQNMQFRFVFSTDGSVISEGVAIDDFLIGDLGNTPRNDIEAVFLGFDNDTSINSNCDDVPKVGMLIQNNSSTSIPSNSITINYRVDNGPIVSETPNISQLVNYFHYYHEFNNQPGNGEITAWVSVNNDVDRSNDTLRTIKNYSTQNFDIELKNILSPVTNYQCGSDSSSIEIVIRNKHSQTISGLPVSYQFDNGPIVNETINTSIPSVCALDSFNYTFNRKIAFNEEGNYTLKVWCDFPLDPNSTNDTLSNVINYSKLKSVPFFENFESAVPGSGDNNLGSIFPNGWTTTDNWGIRNGKSPSATTGPNSGYGGVGNYLLALNSGFSTNRLQMPCIQLPEINSNSILMEFETHMWSLNGGNSALFINVSTVDGNLSNTYPVPTSVQSNRESPYQKVTLNLNQFEGEIVQIEFQSSSGTFNSYIAIDDVKIYETAPTDLAISSIKSPIGSNCGTIGDSLLTVSITNRGNTTIDSFELCYTVNSTMPVCVAVNNGSISPSTTIDYSFPGKIDLSEPGEYRIEAYANYSLDSVNVNDTAKGFFFNSTTPIPFLEDFDSVETVDYFLNWQILGNTSYQWLSNKGVTGSFNTGPNKDGSGSVEGYYFYTESTTGSSIGDTTSLQSLNCFNFSNPSNTVLEFDYHMYGSTMGNLFIEAIVDTGVIVLDSIIGEQQSSASEAWKTKSIGLSDLNSNQVFFNLKAIRGNGEQSDIAIDNFRIRDSTTSINEIRSAANAFNVFPNPAWSEINIKLDPHLLSNNSIGITFYDMTGKIQKTTRLTNSHQAMDIEELKPGVYVIELTTSSGIYRKKFIKSR